MSAVRRTPHVNGDNKTEIRCGRPATVSGCVKSSFPFILGQCILLLYEPNAPHQVQMNSKRYCSNIFH
jgi:hypothetical protein